VVPVLDLVALSAFFEAAVRLGAPLVLAALGETIAERAGVLNLGIEGSMISGALAGALVSLGTGSAELGLVAGVGAGMGVGLVFAFFAVILNRDQIIVGTAVTMAGLGFTGAIYQAAFGATGAALDLPTLQSHAVPGLSSLPLVGQALFAQPITVYLAFALVPILHLYLFRTPRGLELRAAGEAPDAAQAVGSSVRWIRVGAVLFGGAMAGMAGVHLALAHAGTFAENMSAGRGFIAIAVVVLGRWNPVGVLAAGLFFGAASAFQFFLQALGLDVPYQLILALPYALTLLALAGWFGRARAPAALARPWPER
jgi:simple sugar transport system permease protein